MVFGSIKLCETCDPHVFSDNFPFPIRKGNSAADYHLGHQYSRSLPPWVMVHRASSNPSENLEPPGKYSNPQVEWHFFYKIKVLEGVPTCITYVL